MYQGFEKRAASIFRTAGRHVDPENEDNFPAKLHGVMFQNIMMLGD
jgi:hypothetical protein